MSVVRTDGRSLARSEYGHVITKFSGMGRFTYPWCSAGARFARERAPLKRDIGRHILNDLNLNIKRRENLKATYPTIF